MTPLYHVCHALRARIGATGHAEVLGELNNVFGQGGIPNTWDEACEVLTEENYHMLKAFDEKWHQLPDLDCLLMMWDWNRRIQGS